MDRNPYIPLAKVRHCEVALRKESVDRNTSCPYVGSIIRAALSARRAWIEIASPPARPGRGRVALRKESVDRNTNYSPASLFDLPSLSARRAWIEISTQCRL